MEGPKMKNYSSTTYAILGILTTECNTGYDIKQMIDNSLNHFWKISYGQIYPTLKKLEEEGLVEVHTAANGGKPDRREYSLTQSGRQTLREWLENPVEQLPVERNEILLKLFFGSHQSPEKRRELLQEYESRLQERYDTYRAIENRITENSGHLDDAVYWLSTLDYGKRVTNAAIEWCQATIKKVT